ncbi:MAG TPA: hypothetical protein VL282_00580, partial [Tepidisphaeraceae bacterium]|nr:hypothetical protein [Tepidisphaeraceae bacterium]
GGSDDSWIEPLWKTLSGSVKFAQANDLEARLANGAKAVAQIHEHGLSNFLGETRDERWWLYCYDSPDHPIGWLHEEPTASTWRQNNDARFGFPDRGNASVIFHWEGMPNLTSYESTLQRKTFSSDAEERSNLRVSAKLNRGKLDLSAAGTEIDTVKTSIDPSANFLPGGWAGLLIGKLPDKPMIVECESFSGYEGAATQALLRLVITPSSDVARSGLADAKPLRCINVEVNGSGEVSRWFFRADGSLDSIDYADGFRRIRSDLSTIRSEFTNSYMKP